MIMQCLKCKTEIKTSRLKFWDPVICENCGARHFSRQKVIKKGVPLLLFGLIFFTVFTAPYVREWGEVNFGKNIGWLINFMYTALIFIPAYYFFAPKYIKDGYAVRDNMGKPFGKKGLITFIFGVIMVFFTLGLLIWNSLIHLKG